MSERIAIVACMDRRLDPLAVLGRTLGDAYVIRNAGGVVTDDALRSIVIAQRMLGTAEIALVHHTDCGMQKFSGERLRDDLQAETGVRPPFDFATFADLDDDVRAGMRRLRESPYVLEQPIRGYVYDVERSVLREVDA